MKNSLKYPVFVLAMVLLITSFSASFVHVAFSVNKQYVIKELCENRFKPQMRCDGKCYLKKKVNQQQEQNTPTNSHKVQTETFNWMFTGSMVMEPVINNSELNPVDRFADFLSIGFIASLDRPPGLLA